MFVTQITPVKYNVQNQNRIKTTRPVSFTSASNSTFNHNLKAIGKEIVDFFHLRLLSIKDIRELAKHLNAKQILKLQRSFEFQDGHLSPEMMLIFAKVRKLQGEEFLRKTYTLIGESMGYPKECLPELVILSHNHPRLKGAKAGFDDLKGEICIKESIKSKKEIIEAVRHELEHFKQTDMIVRTEDLGLKAVLGSLVVAKLKQKISRIKPEMISDKLEMILAELESENPVINKDFYENLLKRKGKITKNSAQAKEAHRYFSAFCKYSLDNLSENFQSLLEENAYKECYKFSIAYERFMQIIGKKP